jgi:hypothetical protein
MIVAFRDLRGPAAPGIDNEHAPPESSEIHRGRQARGAAADDEAIQGGFVAGHIRAP